MRVGHKYVADDRAGIDRDADQYAATMGYRPGRHASPEDFLAAHDQRWVHELHDALADLLDPQRTVLCIGSGEGEHEVLLHLDGYDVIATDVVPGVLDDAARLFPGLKTMTLDAFGDEPVTCEDVLATGMEFYFDDAELGRLLRAVRARLEPGGRFILVQRYRDTPATWVVDRVALPLVAAVRRRRGIQQRRKAHGYRRSVRDIAALAGLAGFRLGRVEYAAFGMEVERVSPVPEPIIRLDRRVHVLNSATVLELLAA